VSVRDKPSKDERILHVTTLRDPLQEMDKLHVLYDRLVQERKDAGQAAMPFHKFAELVKTQVSSMKDQGNEEVALRVAVRSGKLALTARKVKPPSGKPDAGER
jgi:hypothetical protein